MPGPPGRTMKKNAPLTPGEGGGMGTAGIDRCLSTHFNTLGLALIYTFRPGQ